jgi:hypothetical protein
MAQNFRRYTSNNVGTSAATVFTADSYDTIINIRLANILGTVITASVYINDGANDIYIIKDITIPSGSSVELIDGASRFVVQNGDALKVIASDAASVDVWVSAVDAIST